MLTIGIIGMVVLVLGCGVFLSFGIEQVPAEQAPAAMDPAVLSRFLDAGSRIDDSVAAGRRVPVELLLSQLEQHIRLEEAAAETFLSAPSVRNLHARTTSTLAN